VKFITVAFIAH